VYNIEYNQKKPFGKISNKSIFRTSASEIGALYQKDPDLADKIGMFLYKWLTKHILGADMAYKRFVEKKP